MKKNSARIAVILLAMLAFAGTPLVAGPNRLLAARKAAPAEDAPLSDFMKKVIAAVPDEFAAFKGQEDAVVTGMYKGTLAPDFYSACTMYPRRGDHMENPPLYSCQGPSQTLDAAKQQYQETAAQLRAAFPEWTFTEEKKGDESKREESWTLTAKQPGFTVTLNLFDWGRLADMFNKEPSTGPGLIVTLDVTDTIPKQ